MRIVNLPEKFEYTIAYLPTRIENLIIFDLNFFIHNVPLFFTLNTYSVSRSQIVWGFTSLYTYSNSKYLPIYLMYIQLTN